MTTRHGNSGESLSVQFATDSWRRPAESYSYIFQQLQRVAAMTTNVHDKFGNNQHPAYILGLGDRDMCNIMINNRSAKLIHINFSDCFDIVVNGEISPEKVPFKQTRVMVKALEICDIEGTLRSCIANVMQLLRDNAAEIVALLEAWLCDPVQQMPALNEENSVLKISQRIRDKLNGNELRKEQMLIKRQLDAFIQLAINNTNLAQMDKGWFDWW
jgi:FKBP12-rapamycin complex-associated protein